MHNYKKLLFSSLGSAFEYYDLAIYSVFAVAIGHKFFDSTNTLSNTLLVFLVYIVGYIIRPFGAWVFGYIADIKGRAYVLRLNMFLLFFATLFLVLLPGFESIGITATIIFVALRCVQSIAVGAEIPIAVIFSLEAFPNRQGLVTGIIFAFLSLGIMMTTIVLYFVTTFTSVSFAEEYGWRIGFLIGAIFTFTLFFLRKNIEDTPSVTKLKDIDSDSIKTLPFIARIVVGMMLVACIAMLTTQLYTFLTTFYNMYVASKQEFATMLLSGSIVMAISCVVGGYISDYMSKEKLMSILIIISMAMTPIFYRNLLDGQDIFFSFMILSIVMGFFSSTYNVIIVNYFNFSYRGRGLGLAYNLGYLVFSAGVPALSIVIISRTNELLTPAYMIIGAGIISLIGIVLSSGFKKKA